jgi:hypothetical protein
MSGRKSLTIGPFLSIEVLCGLSEVIGLWLNMRSDRATRGKWRIPDRKVRERSVVIFIAPKVVALPVSIKNRISWAMRNKH